MWWIFGAKCQGKWEKISLSMGSLFYGNVWSTSSFLFLFENPQHIVILSYRSGLAVLALCSSSIDEGERMTCILSNGEK